MTDPNLTVVTVDQQDRRLGRQLVHDERSRAWAWPLDVDRSTWRDVKIRIYDPYPNPNQCHGECTGCAKAMQLNAVGNRVIGEVFGMPMAHKFYSWASQNDPWDGWFNPATGVEDTGSSGLASAKAAQHYGEGGEYRWFFGGGDEVIQAVQNRIVVSIGTWWYNDMFYPDSTGEIKPTGGRVGGHQYVVDGYDVDKDRARIRCWWDGFKWAWLLRSNLDYLLRDGGDAHAQRRLQPAA